MLIFWLNVYVLSLFYKFYSCPKARNKVWYFACAMCSLLISWSQLLFKKTPYHFIPHHLCKIHKFYGGSGEFFHETCYYGDLMSCNALLNNKNWNQHRTATAYWNSVSLIQDWIKWYWKVKIDSGHSRGLPLPLDYVNTITQIWTP